MKRYFLETKFGGISELHTKYHDAENGFKTLQKLLEAVNKEAPPRVEKNFGDGDFYSIVVKENQTSTCDCCGQVTDEEYSEEVKRIGDEENAEYRLRFKRGGEYGPEMKSNLHNQYNTDTDAFKTLGALLQAVNDWSGLSSSSKDEYRIEAITETVETCEFCGQKTGEETEKVVNSV